MLISIETYRTCDFPGGLHPLSPPPLDPRMNLDINSFLASGYFCYQLITFANIIDQDQGQQNVGSTLDPNHLTL